ncbi:4'-phosphopantetheinyl transferase superfamily protein [Ruegeria sp. 2012CJ41-6]|uniref:4'-phosphopantetheinyl transferase superfamily protein n=1 Tax=Ruegeria spongiae TaxID=2942209 RepID=A0ABT0Q5J9_9RHOB|nr:4'-phosphopantetheinyl transferase superfamily protein [Ruegeria spongiae]MCL6285134.1 4'-phosphopantetheinyl transferase superfamily protein [Ruegeria spongiae]
MTKARSRLCIIQHILKTGTLKADAEAAVKIEHGQTRVDLWTLSLDTPALPPSELSAMLNQAERDRAGRFATNLLANRFIAARGQTRMVLAGATGISPEDLVFSTGPFGKPKLVVSNGRAPISFNFSDSQGFGLLAISRQGELGVDIEAIRELEDLTELARRSFSDAEFSALMGLPAKERLGSFYACWTRKEATIKADGRGLSLPLDSFSVTVASTGLAKLLSFSDPSAQAEDFMLTDIPAPFGYRAALAHLAN